MVRCNTSRVLFKYGTRNSTVIKLKIPPNDCSSSSCVSLTSSAVTLSAFLIFITKKASSILFSIVADRLAAVAKSAVLPTCTTPTSSGLPCTIAPLPACAKVCGLVVADGETRKTTLLATLAPSTRA